MKIGITYKYLHTILKRKIKNDFGETRCKDFNISCMNCQAWLMLDILDDCIGLEDIEK